MGRVSCSRAGWLFVCCSRLRLRAHRKSRLSSLLAVLAPALLLVACDSYGTEERLAAAAPLLGAEYSVTTDRWNFTMEGHTLALTAKSGRQRRIELKEPERCKFDFKAEPQTSDVFEQIVDLKKLNRIEVAPTISRLNWIVYLASDSADAVTVITPYRNETTSKARIANLEPREVPAFLKRVVEFQQKNCGVKVTLPAGIS
jgi:hypothetical protein